MVRIKINPQLEDSWNDVLSKEFSSKYFNDLKSFLKEEKKKEIIYPPGKLIFNALNLTPFNKVKVVIIGQDPYHGKGQANGLCFAVNDGIKQPPSLYNIFKELSADIGIAVPKNGNLEKWAKQGVLLLNSILTVRANQAGSHQNKGWEIFTDKIIYELSDRRTGLVFLLWGRFAQNKATLIDQTKHHILKASHPSPLSAHSGFFGCRHFSKTNEILKDQGMEEIDWCIE